MKQDDCLFCKIIDGEIPSAKVYEDEHVYAFMDISQVTKGHTLIIPKIHTKNIYEMDEDVASHLFARVPKVANAIKDAFNPAGINLLNNNEAPAGQTVFHYHIHLIPRYDVNDGFGLNWKTNQDLYSSDDLQHLAEQINAKIK